MIFGPAVNAAPTAEPADWIDSSRPGDWGSLGSLVPAGYDSYLEVDAPEDSDLWLERYREVFTAIASAGATHTKTPEHTWLAVWEGHGFDSGATFYYSLGGKRDRRAERAARAESDARNARIRAALADVTRIALPHRTYYLVGGGVFAATELAWPGADRWFRPDLWWPDDRAWFVATDVDFFRVFIGGSEAMTAGVADAVPTPSRLVSLEHDLPSE